MAKKILRNFTELKCQAVEHQYNTESSELLIAPNTDSLNQHQLE